MIQKIRGLTLRQAQALCSIAYRKNNLGIIKVTDLITDMGISASTLGWHLNGLKTLLLINTPDNRNARGLAFLDEVFITPQGEKLADEFMGSIHSTYDDTPSQIFEKLKKLFSPKTTQTNLFNLETKTASFAKAFEKLVNQNPSEPVLTSIAMYTDLDSQLNLMRFNNNKTYTTLSKVKLNLEIRNGRLASIAVPTVMRGTTKLSELKQMLENSWSWMGTVNGASNRRYWQEAMSLGLLQVRGDSLTTMKPTTIDTISWLAHKTHYTFINTIPVAPKSSLVVFKESFALPSEEDLLKPNQAEMDLPWLNFIRDNINNKEDYTEAIKEGLMIIKDKANVVQEYEGKIIPNTIIRKINSDRDLKKSFDMILRQSESNMITAKILLAITAKPAMTIYELYHTLKSRKATQKITMEKVEDIVSILVARNLVQVSMSSSASKQSTKLYSFTHLPYFTSKMAGNKETNAVIRSMKPYLLQRIEDLFMTTEEKEAVYDVFNDFMDKKEIYFEDIMGEYNNKVFHNKLLILANDLKPFVLLNDDYGGFRLNNENRALNDLIINSIQFSILTQKESYESLGVYSQAITDLIEKDRFQTEEIAEEAMILANDITNQNMKTGLS
jgi:DNA-binding MarR family transcriptional regulator